MRPLLLLCRLLAVIVASVVGGIEAQAEAPQILLYQVNMTIASRFATTLITVEVANERDCADTKSLRLQLPFNSRVTDLKI